MEQKIILFQGGTHGNFLEKYLNVGCGYNKNFDFYSNNNGAHNFKNYEYEKVKYTCDHPNESLEDKNIFCYIYINKKDLYKLMWHTFYAVGEFGFNVLDRNQDFISFNKKRNNNKTHPLIKDDISFQHFEKSSNGLREYFKKYFKKSNGFLANQESIIKKYNIENYFYFEDFYSNNFDQKIKNNLDIDIKVRTNNHQNFLKRKKDILESEHKVKSAVDAFIKVQYYSLEDFCLYEQAYLDHLIEEHYNITLKTFYEHYPSNTLEYEIREDK